MQDAVTQIIGFFGVAMFLISYQVKSNRRLFIFQTLGCGLFFLQFLLLGAYSGCLALCINITRNIMLTGYQRSRIIRWKGWILVFSAASVLSAAITWDGFISILPVVGTISGIVAYWSNNARKIRTANLFINSPCMLIYDFLIHSWAGVLNESITITSIIVSIIRFGWKAMNGDTIGDTAE